MFIINFNRDSINNFEIDIMNNNPGYSLLEYPVIYILVNDLHTSHFVHCTNIIHKNA